jgi:hypothetical protein
MAANKPSDGGQQANDGHNDHDFHQGETRFAGLFHSFHVPLSL